MAKTTQPDSPETTVTTTQEQTPTVANTPTPEPATQDVQEKDYQRKEPKRTDKERDVNAKVAKDTTRGKRLKWTGEDKAIVPAWGALAQGKIYYEDELPDGATLNPEFEVLD